MSLYQNIDVKSVRPLHDNVIVHEMKFDQRVTSAGIVLLSADGKIHGVHPRWGKVYAVGPEQQDIKVGQWILIAHGRWTRGVHIKDDAGEHVIRRVDLNDILAISDVEVADENMGVPLTQAQLQGAPG